MDPANIDLTAFSQTELEDHLAQVCSHYYAAEFHLLRCIQECERRGGDLSHGMKSTAHWLHARFGIALGAAREKVRVAHALAELPTVSETLSRGQISYSKVRALTRIATPDNEAELLQFAERSTAADMEQLCKEYRQLEKLENPQWPAIQYRMRRLGWYWDEEGMLVIEGRLPPAEGALFIRLVESMRDQLYREEQARKREAEASAAEGTAESRAEHAAESVKEGADDAVPTSAGERRADALLCLVEDRGELKSRALASAARTQVTLHLVVDERKAAAGPAPMGSGLEPSSPVSARPDARLEPGPVIGAATARRLCCDAAKVSMIENEAGDPLSVGRQSRIVPWHIRKALEQRDGGCCFPSCSERHHVDAHHIEHWVDGGETSLANCCLVCRFHHRLLHEEGYRCEKVDDALRFYDPNGRELGEPAMLPPAVGYPIGQSVSAETPRLPGSRRA
ncbi:MAG: DUF222 domain-containing protein [Gammaproteobacteria bacterium]|nr:DUF222 domain-containing protein [Gammaproteobacteria bacterium]